jgi:DNA-binding MarR family transcriptional regulator
MEPDIATATLKALRRILRATETGRRRIATTTGLTPSQLLLLRELAASPRVTPSTVAASLEFSQATITALVDRLETEGLVTRSRSDVDRRQVLLELTPAGHRRLSDAPDMLQALFIERFAALPAWEQAMILAGSERLADLLGAEDTDAAPLLDVGAIDRAGGEA